MGDTFVESSCVAVVLLNHHFYREVGLEVLSLHCPRMIYDHNAFQTFHFGERPYKLLNILLTLVINGDYVERCFTYVGLV